MNKKKWMLWIAAIILIALVITVIIIMLKDNKSDTNIPSGNTVQSENRLGKYISSLKDNYYIYYSGDFENISSDTVKASIYYSKSGDSFALKSDDLNIHIVFKESKLYNISHTFRFIVVMDKEAVDISKYNLISLDKKEYIHGVQEDDYYVEEYKMGEKIVKYYFEDTNLKKIQIGKNGEFRDVSFTVESNTRQDVFVINEDYEKTYA